MVKKVVMKTTSQVVPLKLTTIMFKLIRRWADWGGVGRGPPFKKDKGARPKFWKEPIRDTKTLFCVWLEIFYTPNIYHF